MRSLGWAAIVALLVSAVANLVGNVSLAEMLTVGIIDVGYVGLVLYAGVTVFASVIRLLLARRALSRFSIVTQHAGPLLHSLTRLLRLGALLAWLVVVLNEFRVFRPIRDAAVRMLTYPLTFGEISLTLGGVLLFFFSVWLAFWAARTVRVVLKVEGTPHCLRRVDTDLHYPGDLNGRVHHDGQIWSRALWDIRNALGHVVADTIILEAQFSFAPETNMPAAAQATLNAAEQLYGSPAANAVRAAFQARGILP